MDNTATAPARAARHGRPALAGAAASLAWVEALTARISRQLASSRAVVVGLLVVVSLACFLPGFFTIPPVDRDEARFAQASKQMVETRRLFDIRFQDEARYKKPIGIYWLQAASAALSGRGAQAPIWVYRLPSLLGAVASVLLTYWTALVLVGRPAAALAALFMATSVLLGVEARLATTDSVLLATILGATGVLARAYLGRPIGWGPAVAFWAALAAGVLVKGPVVLMVVGLTALTLSLLDRSAAWLRALHPLPGAALALILVLPWFVAIGLASHGAFFADSVGHDMFDKLIGGQESHGAPPGSYLAAFWIAFWPAAGLVLAAAPWAWANRHDPAVRFCLAWAVPSWIVFELIPTKLPHYILPMLPAVAILIAGALAAGRRPGRLLASLIAAGGAGLAIAAAAALFAIEHHVSATALGFSALGILALAAAAYFAAEGAALSPAALLATGAALLFAAIFGVTMPRLQSLWISPHLAAAVARQAACPTPQVAATGFSEPSLVFLVGTRTALVEPAAAADFLTGGPCRLALVESRREAEFEAELARLGRPALLGERLMGLNLNGMRRLDIGVYRFGDARQ